MSTKNQAKPKTQSSKLEPKKTQTPKIAARIDSLVDFEGSKTKAFASVNIGDAFAVHGIKIVEGEKGVFVSMPQRKDGEDYKDVFHPITAEAREEMNKQILNAYEQKLEEEHGEQLDEGADQEPVTQTM
ncbi:MAG: SpoVG family protein [Clostridia bacterium]|nr:SpoVG family protein [Clostridia bacterium]